jgi:phosphatidylglycerol:prolipoprotein diacylglycerol transferase
VRFPVLIHLGPWTVDPHVFFVLLGYAAGVALFLRLRRREGDPIGRTQRWIVVAAALIGSALGARALAWPDGKTIVGGMIGGLIAVELVKWRIGVRSRTGDLFALPLCVGIAIGRLGCFLEGLGDATYGNPTSLFTGVDFGDGIPRHPTQLYESAFVLLLAAFVIVTRERFAKAGDRFRLFMVSYMSFRLLVDFIKPEPRVAMGLSVIQWACVATLLYYAADARKGYIWEPCSQPPTPPP